MSMKRTENKEFCLILQFLLAVLHFAQHINNDTIYTLFSTEYSVMRSNIRLFIPNFEQTSIMKYTRCISCSEIINVQLHLFLYPIINSYSRKGVGGQQEKDYNSLITVYGHTKRRRSLPYKKHTHTKHLRVILLVFQLPCGFVVVYRIASGAEIMLTPKEKHFISLVV